MDAHKEEIAATFDVRARGYRNSDWHRASAGRLVDLCGLKPGDRVLDAGTGTGFAALHAARQIGDHGRVVGVDISQGMLSEARADAAAADLTNVEFIQCDATSLTQFADSAFDVVTAATSLIYIPVEEGLRESHRLLGAGGLMAFSTIEAGFPLAGRLFRECAAEYRVHIEDPCAPLGSADACRNALAAAGFVDAENCDRTDPVLHPRHRSGLGVESPLAGAQGRAGSAGRIALRLATALPGACRR